MICDKCFLVALVVRSSFAFSLIILNIILDSCIISKDFMALSYSLSKFANHLIKVFETREKEISDERVIVNALVSKVAFFYEKFRTAMDYGNEETILRRAIERILKRKLFLEQNTKSIAEGLVRELVWAGYFQNATVPQFLINDIGTSIKLHLELKDKVIEKKALSSDKANEFIFQILSCQIFHTLIPLREKEAVGNFMFQVLKDSVEIEDDTEQTKDIQVFIAIRKTFSKDDIAFLRYKLFNQIFGELSEENFNKILTNFEKSYKEINYQLSYPQREKIVSFIKRRTPAFLILYDILSMERNHIRALVLDERRLKERIFDACEARYTLIKSKVRRAIIRSFIFILFTKVIVALSVEGTFESIVIGRIQWTSIFLNTVIPPAIMVAVGLSIKTPDEHNSQSIYEDIQKLLFEEKPALSEKLSIKVKKNRRTLKDYIFSILWFLSIILAFGIIWMLLDKLNFNIVSKLIFMFFIAVISFLSYRIYQTANSYTVSRKQSILTPIFDFFFVPIIRVGQKLTEGIAQINFILLVIDFIIETPFKSLIGFFEQWFMYVANKREELE